MTSRVDNNLYRSVGHAWWDEDVGLFSTVRFFISPVRFGYFRRVLEREDVGEPAALKVLDAGYGGGLLAEESARVGYRVTGMDPVPEFIADGFFIYDFFAFCKEVWLPF